MSDISNQPQSSLIQAAYRDGRRAGLATAALALSVVAFVNLLGLEKSLLSIVLAIFALKGTKNSLGGFLRGHIAICIAAVHAATVIAVVLIFHDRLIDLLHQLQKLS